MNKELENGNGYIFARIAFFFSFLFAEMLLRSDDAECVGKIVIARRQ